MGSRIKSARIEAGLTQEALAEKIGVVLKIAKDYEGDRRNPKTDRWPVIADALGKPIGWFFEDADKTQTESKVSAAPEDPPIAERTLIQMLAKQQDLLVGQQAMMAEQQAMMERQRQDVAHLTSMLERQQEHFIAQQQWQQRQAASQAEKQQAMIDALVHKVESLEAQLLAQAHRPTRPRQQFDSPANPGLAGGG